MMIKIFICKQCNWHRPLYCQRRLISYYLLVPASLWAASPEQEGLSMLLFVLAQRVRHKKITPAKKRLII